MKNSHKMESMRRSCSVNELLRDISSSPSFSKNSELAGIYTSLASSFFKMAQGVTSIVRCRNSFDDGLQDAYRDTRLMSGGSSFAHTPLYAWGGAVTAAFNTLLMAPGALSGHVIEEAARACGRIGRIYEFLWQLADSGNYSQPFAQKAIKHCKAELNRQIVKHMKTLVNFMGVIRTDVANANGTTPEELEHLFGGDFIAAMFSSKLSAVLNPQIIVYLKSLAPTITEYTQKIDQYKGNPLNILYGFANVFYKFRKEIESGTSDIYTRYSKPDVDAFMEDFWPVPQNPTTVTNFADSMCKEAITSSVPDSGAFYDGSGTEPDYNAAAASILGQIQTYGSTKFHKLYLSIAVLYALVHPSYD